VIATGVTRAAIVAEARRWLGTPYRHQTSVMGVGCDCFGLIRGVWRAFYGPEPEAVPPYSRDWGSVTGKEAMLDTARRHLIPIEKCALRPGDLLVFRIRRGTVAKHAGILTAEGRFIHAQEHVPVSEVAFSTWWRRNVAAAFAFPSRRLADPRAIHL